MPEMKIMGSRDMIDQAIPDEVKEHFGLDVKGGDTKIIWNPRDRDEREHAKSTFDGLREKRFMAYKVDPEGKKGEQISEFDPEAGKLILAPPMAGGC